MFICRSILNDGLLPLKVLKSGAMTLTKTQPIQKTGRKISTLNSYLRLSLGLQVRLMQLSLTKRSVSYISSDKTMYGWVPLYVVLLIAVFLWWDLQCLLPGILTVNYLLFWERCAYLRRKRNMHWDNRKTAIAEISLQKCQLPGSHTEPVAQYSNSRPWPWTSMQIMDSVERK